MVRCPSCDAEFVLFDEQGRAAFDQAGMLACRCGHRVYAGYLAEAIALDQRRAWLTDRIRDQDPPPPPELARQYRVWPPPMAGGAAGAAAAPGGAGVQNLLLGIGALLLTVSFAVFAAVSWQRLGPAGQSAVLAAASVGTGAVAIRLRHRLRGTAEALAVVGAGLAAITLYTAPLVGLLPRWWVDRPGPYLPAVLALLGGGLLLLARRFDLGAWRWTGWSALAAASLTVAAVLSAEPASDNVATASLAVPAGAGLWMLTAPRADSRSLRPARAAGLSAAGIALAVAFFATTDRSSLAGATAVAAVAALVLAIAASRARSGTLESVAAAFGGGTAALLLAIPDQEQRLWWAAPVALAGLLAGIALARRGLATATAGAASIWATWVFLRSACLDACGPGSAAQGQVAMLAALVAAILLAVAWWVPAAGWFGAAAGLVALLLAPVEPPQLVEWTSLPFAAMLLAAGLLWRHGRRGTTLGWLGPAVSAALLPSALAGWAAPWVFGYDTELGPHLVRFGLVMATGTAAALVGARWRLGGLLLPASVALVILALAQVSGGLATLPRWLALGLAGSALILAGARIEFLRAQGRRAVRWVGELR